MSDFTLNSDCGRASMREGARVQQLIHLTQAGLPLEADPWAWLGEQLNMQVDEILAWLSVLQAQGVIRRIAAVPNHYRLGFRHNGMTVWDIDDAHIAALGSAAGALACVSHCYRRPRRPGWPYNLFAMVHGRTRQELDQHYAMLRRLLDAACRGSDMLISTQILKKTGLRLVRPANRSAA